MIPVLLRRNKNGEAKRVRVRCSLAFATALLTAGVIGRAQELPPEVAADKHLVAADRYVHLQMYHFALGEMDKAMALQEEHGFELPDCTIFKYAETRWSAGLLELAAKSARQYLSTSVRESECYREALQFLDRAESTITALESLRDWLDKAIADRNASGARILERQISDLADREGFPKGVEFLFVEARIAWLEGAVAKTIITLRRYLDTPGEDTDFRDDALGLLAEAEALTRPIEPEMVTIRAGKFRMGCVNGDPSMRRKQRHGYNKEGCPPSALPAHEVTIASPFAMSKHEVTKEEYSRFVNSTGRGASRIEDPNERIPVQVSWNIAAAYAKWLSDATGKRYRLPSEAEWEYAARAGTTTRYSWGNKLVANRANCHRCGSRWDSDILEATGKDSLAVAPVGSFAPNPWRLHDMHGNVSEWVRDCGDYIPAFNDKSRGYAGAPDDGSARESRGCEKRVRRGCDRISMPIGITSWRRDFDRPSHLSAGIRLVRELP